jgi:hypothetical protein
MIDKKKLKTLFSQELRAAGFAAKSGSWYRDTEETVQVINLQKSNYDDSYFLNLDEAAWRV